MQSSVNDIGEVKFVPIIKRSGSMVEKPMEKPKEIAKEVNLFKRRQTLNQPKPVQKLKSSINIVKNNKRKLQRFSTMRGARLSKLIQNSVDDLETIDE